MVQDARRGLRWCGVASVRCPRRSAAGLHRNGVPGTVSARVQVGERVCAVANSTGCTRGRVGALAWHAAAPGGVARPWVGRRAIARRLEETRVKRGMGT